MYPKPYTTTNNNNNNIDCVWIGELPAGSHVSLTFTEFDLPASTNCSAGDRLVVQNGEHVDSPIVASLCGQLHDLKHHTYLLSGSHFRVHLISATGGNTPSGSSSAAIRSQFRFNMQYNTISTGKTSEIKSYITKCNLSYFYPIINIVAIVVYHPYYSSR